MAAASISSASEPVFSRHPHHGRHRAVRQAGDGQPLPVLWQPIPTARTSRLARRSPSRPTCSARYSIYDQNVTLAPSATGAGGVAADPAGRGGRTAARVRGRRHHLLQHARQQEEPDQRHQFAAQAGSRRPRRRREVPAHTEDVRYYHSINSDLVAHGARPGRLHHRLGAVSRCRWSTTSSAVPRMVRGFAPNGFGPRDLTPGSTMDNVGGSMYLGDDGGAAERDSRHSPGIRAARARSSSMPARVFGYSGPTTFGGKPCRSPTRMCCARRSAPA